LFYLGKRYDLSARARLGETILYDSKDLLTHAVCVGMTGSGKTGLGIGLIEEAAIDGVPVLAIDPKGDLSNLLLTFPQLTAADFAPWVPQDAATASTAEHEASAWKAGLAAWPRNVVETARQMVQRAEMLRGTGAREEAARISTKLAAKGYRQSISNVAKV
jgi:hypothetical protein